MRRGVKWWVRLPIQHSGPWLTLGFWERALGTELLRHFGDARRMEGLNRATFHEAAARMMAVDARARRDVRGMVEKLFELGLLVERDGGIDILHTDAGMPRPAMNRASIFERDEWLCTYCRTPITLDTGAVDHVIPRSRGGADSEHNLVAACTPCNVSKGNMMVSEWRAKP